MIHLLELNNWVKKEQKKESYEVVMEEGMGKGLKPHVVKITTKGKITSQEACVEISTTFKVSIIFINIDFNMLMQTFNVM
jgi:hypothetical protein